MEDELMTTLIEGAYNGVCLLYENGELERLGVRLPVIEQRVDAPSRAFLVTHGDRVFTVRLEEVNL